MTHGEEKEKRWRLWQFSVRVLLVLTLVVAAFLSGWKASEWRGDLELRDATENSAERFHLPDDVQYFPPGPEINLKREVSAMKAYQLKTRERTSETHDKWR